MCRVRVLRAMSLHNRDRYDVTSRWHYWEMQRRDYWQGGAYPGASPHYEGTSADAGGQVMRLFGAIRARHGGRPVDPHEAAALASPTDGIAAYRWARD